MLLCSRSLCCGKFGHVKIYDFKLAEKNVFEISKTIFHLLLVFPDGKPCKSWLSIHDVNREGGTTRTVQVSICVGPYACRWAHVRLDRYMIRFQQTCPYPCPYQYQYPQPYKLLKKSLDCCITNMLIEKRTSHMFYLIRAILLQLDLLHILLNHYVI